MKKLNLFLIFFLTVLTSYAQGISFLENLGWQQVKSKAKAENKYIFMDAFATWCGPCKAMSEKVFPLTEVGQAINNRFVAVKVQMDQTKADNEYIKSWYISAKEIDKKYRITAYPTILFFSPEGDLIYRTVGFKDAKDLIEDANEAITLKAQFDIQYKAYIAGKRDSSFIMELARKANLIEQKELAMSIAQDYINTLNQKELFKSYNLKFVNQFTQSTKDKGFKVFLRQGKKVNTVLGTNEAERKITSIIRAELINESLHGVVPSWDKLAKTAKKKYGGLGSEAIYGSALGYYWEKQTDWNKYGIYFKKYYSTALSRMEYNINAMTWPVFEHISDQLILNYAAEVQKYSLDNFPTYDGPDHDTYANLLYKAGKVQEAIKWQEKAVNLDKATAVKQNRKPDLTYAQNLAKMKEGIKTWP
ncbi:thioredoxin fold domain-containing protein [Pedobacter sp. PWIIR3]